MAAFMRITTRSGSKFNPLTPFVSLRIERWTNDDGMGIGPIRSNSRSRPERARQLYFAEHPVIAAIKPDRRIADGRAIGPMLWAALILMSLWAENLLGLIGAGFLHRPAEETHMV